MWQSYCHNHLSETKQTKQNKIEIDLKGSPFLHHLNESLFKPFHWNIIHTSTKWDYSKTNTHLSFPWCKLFNGQHFQGKLRFLAPHKSGWPASFPSSARPFILTLYARNAEPWGASILLLLFFAYLVLNPGLPLTLLFPWRALNHC